MSWMIFSFLPSGALASTCMMGVQLWLSRIVVVEPSRTSSPGSRAALGSLFRERRKNCFLFCFLGGETSGRRRAKEEEEDSEEED